MVLLDSEGIHAAASEGFYDHQIFTLTVLLASVLVYNSQDVPTRHDIEGLEYPFSEEKRQLNLPLRAVASKRQDEALASSGF